MEPQASSKRGEGPGADAFLPPEPSGEARGASAQPSKEGQAQGGDQTSQAERAAMHPDQHDLEWRYYCHAWSH